MLKKSGKKFLDPLLYPDLLQKIDGLLLGPNPFQQLPGKGFQEFCVILLTEEQTNDTENITCPSEIATNT